MRLLLDTHVLLWWLADDPALSKQARQLIANEPEVFASAASAWEIAIKRALGKLEAPADLPAALAAGGIGRLPIEFEHAAIAGALPRHHDDPFDRMLVAQARVERLTLVSRDRRLEPYGGAIIWA
jgi:PIN domain nuclease of toxin-antitoxin system